MGHSVTTVCDAHRIAYLKLYVMNQKKCCDPHGIHKKTRGLKVITVSMAQQQSTSDLKLVPGKKLCTLYRKNLSSPQQFLDSPSGDDATDTSKEPSDDNFGAQEDLVTSRISSLLVSLDQSPIDHMKKRYAEGKMKMIDQTIRKKLKLDPCKKEEEYLELLEQLKKKFNDSTKKSEKLQVLTVLPQSWTLQRIKEESGATKHMARKAKDLGW